MLRRPRPKDEVQLLEACRRNPMSVVVAFDLAFVIVDYIDAANQVLSRRGRPLSSDQQRRWRYELTRDLLIEIGEKEQRWLDEEEGKVRFWFWSRRPRAILNQKWNSFLSQTGPGGLRQSLRRYTRAFVSDWIRAKLSY